MHRGYCPSKSLWACLVSMQYSWCAFQSCMHFCIAVGVPLWRHRLFDSLFSPGSIGRGRLLSVQCIPAIVPAF